VFGSDFPYYTETENIGGLEKLGLSEAQLKAIYFENAYRLVPRLKA
jgi:predicted TIM-barrel fold metal-dependent hydrolase